MIFLDDVIAGEMVATTRAGAITETNAVPSLASVVCICCNPAVSDGNRIVFPSSETTGFLDDFCAIELASLFYWHPVFGSVTSIMLSRRMMFLVKNTIVFIDTIPFKID
jgi:hypothetical protein